MTERNGRQGGEVSVWEWVAAAFGTVVVLGVVGFMLGEALGEAPTPPRITIEVDSIVDGGAGYLVEFSVTNRGRTTAADLNLEARLTGEAGEVETSGTTIDFVPGEGSRSAGVFFTHDPRRYRLQIRPVGYDRP